MSTAIHNKLEKHLETFADRLRTARKAKALGQTDLAEKIGVSGGSVGNWEIGPSQPRQETLGKLATVLEVTPAWLLYGGTMAGVPASPGRGPALHDKISDREAPGDDPMREKCRRYFDHFLKNCKTPQQLGWLYCELTEKFPLTKFSEPARGAVNSAPASGAEELLDALEEAPNSGAPSRRRKR